MTPERIAAARENLRGHIVNADVSKDLTDALAALERARGMMPAEIDAAYDRWWAMEGRWLCPYTGPEVGHMREGWRRVVELGFKAALEQIRSVRVS